jgi:hypothetical protein
MGRCECNTELIFITPMNWGGAWRCKHCQKIFYQDEKGSLHQVTDEDFVNRYKRIIPF